MTWYHAVLICATPLPFTCWQCHSLFLVLQLEDVQVLYSSTSFPLSALKSTGIMTGKVRVVVFVLVVVTALLAVIGFRNQIAALLRSYLQWTEDHTLAGILTFSSLYATLCGRLWARHLLRVKNKDSLRQSRARGLICTQYAVLEDCLLSSSLQYSSSAEQSCRLEQERYSVLSSALLWCGQVRADGARL